MDVRTLRYFVAIAKAENFTVASEALHVTQPTLSKQMKALEEDLGKQLLIRGSRKVSLTAENEHPKSLIYLTVRNLKYASRMASSLVVSILVAVSQRVCV